MVVGAVCKEQPWEQEKVKVAYREHMLEQEKVVVGAAYRERE